MSEGASTFSTRLVRGLGGLSMGNIIKRLFDIFAALFGFLLLWPFFIFVAVLIRRDSPGPIFYHGPRLGKHGKPFRIHKFRTMVEDGDGQQGPPVTAHDDERITPVGRWLRDTKLNELPQLWNVLVGEMSWVGPRPEDPEIAQTWSKEVFDEILSMRPGITSPASVIYRNEEQLLNTEQVMNIYLESILPSKLRLDQLYVRHHSLLLDLDIIFLTLMVIVRRVEDVALPEDRLFLGPISRLGSRYLNWFFADMLISFLALGFVGLLWRSVGPLDVGWFKAIVILLAFGLSFSLSGAILGVNRVAWSRAQPADAFDLVPPILLATLLVLGLNFFWRSSQAFPLLLILAAAALAFFGFIALRYRARLLSGFSLRWLAWRGGVKDTLERVLIVGGGETGQFTTWLLSSGRNSSIYRVVGFVDDDLYKQGNRIKGINVLGKRADIPRLVEKHDVGLILFAIHNISPAERQQFLEICAQTPARVVIVPDIIRAVSMLVAEPKANGAQRKAPQNLAGDENGAFIIRQGGKESTLSLSLDQPGLLPCELCFIKVSPLKVDAWLADLEALAMNGDLEKLQSQIQILRKQLGPDVQAQKDTGKITP